MCEQKVQIANIANQILYFPRWISVVLLLLLASTQIRAEQKRLSVSLSCFKEQIAERDPNQEAPVLIPTRQVVRFDPVVFKLVITNNSEKDISVLSSEFIPRTVIPIFKRAVDGKLQPPQVKWLASHISDYVNIAPGKSCEALLHLEEIFPLGLPEGAYQIRFNYTPDYITWIRTNTVNLEVTPLTETGEKQFKEVLKILQAGVGVSKSEEAELFLKSHPDSRFANMLRLELANNQMAQKNFPAAISTLELIMVDEQAKNFERNKTRWLKAHILKKIGKLDDAIQCMEKVQFRYAKREVIKWKKEQNPK